MPIPPETRKQLAKAVKANKEPARKSLWDGPSSNTPNGGITFTMLSKFLCCRERFRLNYVEGIKAEDEFSGILEYGNMWHLCEQMLAGTGAEDSRMVAPHKAEWEMALRTYCAELVRKYPNNGPEIDKLYCCCKVQFPIYVEYWRKHSDVKKRKPVYQEQTFSVEYKLPSGRIVVLRGKFDSVDIIEKKLWLQENKSKADPDEEKIRQQLPFDLQTMMYLTALEEEIKGDRPAPPRLVWKDLKFPIGGVRYNVIRRPLSGQKFNIKQKKGLGKVKKGAENKDQFYARLGTLIKDNASQFFLRMKMEVEPAELAMFQRKCLNPILEQLLDWWSSIEGDPFNPWKASGKHAEVEQHNSLHFYYPHGVYNPALEGRSTSVDNYIMTGDMRGLQRTDQLFTELQ